MAQAIGGVALGLAAAQVVLALFRPKPVRHPQISAASACGMSCLHIST
jgi:hypothetical protein